MKYIELVFFSLIFIHNNYTQQFYSKIYPSLQAERTADGISSLTTLNIQNEAILVNLQWSILNANKYSYASKVNSFGEIIWSKQLSDSINFLLPKDCRMLNNGFIFLCGSKYFNAINKRQMWYAYYDQEMNLLHDHIINDEFDNPEIQRILQLKNSELVLCGHNSKYNNRGNGASEKARAMVMRVDTLGNVKWYHEFYDSTDEKELHGFSGLAEDEDGNVYVSGANGNRDGNGDAIMAKIDRDGKVLWYRQYSSKDAEGFTSLYLQKNGSILAIGFSGSPDIFSTSWLKVYVANLDRNGNINWEKKHSLRYDVGFSNCVAADDGNYVCTGAVQDKEEPDGKDNRDGFLQKLSPNGDVIWEHQYSNWNRRVEFFWNLSKAYDGGYFLGGMSWISEDVHESRSWVVKTDSNGCIVPGCTTDFITEKEPHKDLFLLSPNPTQDYVNVYMNDVEFYDRKYDLHLYDQQGRIVQHHVVQGRVTQVDLSSLSAGMYYYRIVDERNKVRQSGKVVVNR